MAVPPDSGAPGSSLRIEAEKAPEPVSSPAQKCTGHEWRLLRRFELTTPRLNEGKRMKNQTRSLIVKRSSDCVYGYFVLLSAKPRVVVNKRGLNALSNRHSSGTALIILCLTLSCFVHGGQFLA